MRIIVLSLIFISVLTSFSCKDYLDIKNNNRLAVPTGLSDLQALLDNYENMNYNVSPSYLESASDDYFLTEEYFNSIPPEQRPVYTWNPIIYNYPNDWADGYKVVYNANFCLDGIREIQKSEGNETAWNNVYGSALFFRAISYLGLLWVYAPPYDPNGKNDDLAIVLRNSSDFNEPSKRSTTQSCYDRVIEDLLECVKYLPERPQVKSRPSKAAAYALLARTYLSMSLYKEALEFAEYSLAISKDLINYNTPSDGIDIFSDTPFDRFNKETLFYNDIVYNFYLHSPWNAYVDTLLYQSYDDYDLRKVAFFKLEDSYHKFKGTYSQSISNLFSGLTTAEVYFIKMETMARIGDFNKGIDLLNHFLSYRFDAEEQFVKVIAATRKEAVDLVLKERRKELLFRGLRLSDVKRLNLAGSGIIMKRYINGKLIELPPNDNRVILNLPVDIIKYLN